MTKIRVLSADEWQDARAVRLRSLTEAPSAFTSNLAREEAYDEATWRDRVATRQWFVAVDGGLVGVAIGVEGWFGDPSVRELVGMWVAPSHRRSGVATQLLEEVRGWAASDGAATLRLGVREGNEGALAAYLSMGLRVSGERMREVDHPTSLILVMECDVGLE